MGVAKGGRQGRAGYSASAEAELSILAGLCDDAEMMMQGVAFFFALTHTHIQSSS